MHQRSRSPSRVESKQGRQPVKSATCYYDLSGPKSPFALSIITPADLYFFRIMGLLIHTIQNLLASAVATNPKCLDAPMLVDCLVVRQ